MSRVPITRQCASEYVAREVLIEWLKKPGYADIHFERNAKGLLVKATRPGPKHKSR